VAATGGDTLNLAVVEQARRENPDVFVVAQQVKPVNRALYRASGADLVLVAAEVVAHEVLARVTSPVLWQFLHDLALHGEPMALPLRDRLVQACGEQVPLIWSVHVTGDGAPAVVPRLWTGTVRLGDLLRSPESRDDRVPAVPLALIRDSRQHLLPGDDVELTLGDELLLAGRPSARRLLDTTLLDESTAAYVLTGAQVPTTWVGRALTRSPATPR
jgi:hypothetical protein